MNFVIGYFLIVVVGLILGLLGAGGTIITLPILVYAFGQDVITAISYSLLFVGCIALFSTLSHARNKNVDFIIGTIFAFSAFPGVIISRILVMPNLPAQVNLFSLISWDINQFLMQLFAIIMFFAAISMIRPYKANLTSPEINSCQKYFYITFQGFVIGLISGLFGAGGGFLIVPILNMITNLDIKKAIGTSLFIITINCFVGLASDLMSGIYLDIKFTLSFLIFAFLGLIIGIRISNNISKINLRKLFGWVLLSAAVIIFIQEIYML